MTASLRMPLAAARMRNTPSIISGHAKMNPATSVLKSARCRITTFEEAIHR